MWKDVWPAKELFERISLIRSDFLQSMTHIGSVNSLMTLNGEDFLTEDGRFFLDAPRWSN